MFKNSLKMHGTNTAVCLAFTKARILFRKKVLQIYLRGGDFHF